MAKEYGHVPVMVARCLELLEPAAHDGAVFVDCTLGMGGHSEAILKEFPPVSYTHLTLPTTPYV